ncbi:hypothetical protein P7K49_021058 [Saguinus oedipus]|uniref:KN homeodomain domain-containing protein n=1 Tax=Saguinus oedipus TaxID=9490 RepID=A0ABQ9URK4_SAGOE|nr:hypothetical protein P7K49_021058 [Saguinus oedipus]
MCPALTSLHLSFQHPYPTEDEKRQIAAQTNLTLLQKTHTHLSTQPTCTAETERIACTRGLEASGHLVYLTPM